MSRCLYFRESADEIRNRADAVKAMAEIPFAKGLNDGGFESLTDFLNEVRLGGLHGRNPLSRRFAMYAEYADQAFASVKAITGASTVVDSDSLGGLLLPGGMSDRLWRSAIEDSRNAPLAMCSRRTTEGNSYRFRSWNNTSQATGSRFGGLRAYRMAEGDQGTISTPKVRVVEDRLSRLQVTLDCTEELFDDAGPAFDQEITDAASEELAFTISDEMINGRGVAQLLGVVNAPCKIKVNAASGQTAGTIIPKNIADMWSRMPGALRSECVWNMNEDCDPVLMFASAISGATNRSEGVAFQEPGSVAGSPYAHLCGRPIISTPQCQALGTEGDIILAHWPSYALVTKTVPISKAASIHVRFDSGAVAYKFVLRTAGGPIWDSPRTSLNGTTKSPFITLATR